MYNCRVCRRPCYLRHDIVASGRDDGPTSPKHRTDCPAAATRSTRAARRANDARRNVQATVRQSGNRHALIHLDRNVKFLKSRTQPFQPICMYPIARRRNVIRDRYRRSERELPLIQAHPATRHVGPDPGICRARRWPVSPRRPRQGWLRVH